MGTENLPCALLISFPFCRFIIQHHLLVDMLLVTQTCGASVCKASKSTTGGTILHVHVLTLFVPYSASLYANDCSWR